MPQSRTVEHSVRRPPFGAPHVFVLAVVDGDDPAATLRLVRAETVFGRGDEADVTFEDDEVSARHCLVRVDGPVCTVTDLGSLNGTFVNTRRLREGVAERLRHLDEVRVGGTQFLLLSGRFRRRPPLRQPGS